MVKDFQSLIEFFLGYRPTRRESKVALVVCPIATWLIYVGLVVVILIGQTM